MSSSSAVPPSVQVLAFLPGDTSTENIRRLLEEEGLSVAVRSPDAAASTLTQAPEAGAWVLDEAMDPDDLAHALRQGALAATSPVFVLARRLPHRERYLEWLDAGAWDILKVPLEGVALALRLRNILGGRGAEPNAVAVVAGYSSESLLRVAEEALALARRYDRPLHCIAAEIERRDVPAGDDPEPFIRRLADSIQRLTRRSDLIGIADQRTLIVLLPDTDAAGAETFVERMVETLEDTLRRRGIAASIRTALVSASNTETGHELLDLAEQKLRTTRP